jgi:group II intron reverse transcriptase/maturase
MELFETTLFKGKTQPVTMQQVQEAYKKVKRNGGAGGVDGQSLADYDTDKVNNLYKLWNRLASGSYHPEAVRTVEIPKSDGSKRKLGIPTITDRIAQQVVKDVLEPRMEKIFHKDSYGYRPHKSAHDAIGQCRERCFSHPYVLDLDIKGFFDNITHELMLQILHYYVSEKWILLYVERWLRSPIRGTDGQDVARTQGTPQGGVISPLLANMFLHVVFDSWISHHYASLKWERYADDIIIHCWSKTSAQELQQAVERRLETMGLTAHPDKTKIVYCKNARRKDDYPINSFTFLGYCFQPRRCANREGLLFLGFTPSISPKAAQHIRDEVRKYRIHRAAHLELPQIAALFAPKLRGWIHYYGKFTPSGMERLLSDWFNEKLGRWVKNKYKTCRGSLTKGMDKLKEIYKSFPNLFVHWQYGYHP